jgi:hypothetical protein
MNDSAILLPVMTLAGWTFVVLLCIPFQRFRAGFRRQVTEKDFRYGESQRVPPEVSLPNRNFMNLLEVPVLFYLLCVLYYVTQSTIANFVALAWVYVALRVIHSLIHLTYNRVRHRLVAFALSNVVVVVMWTRLLAALW